jgi:ketosteroid isomerase-like protein
MSLLEEAMKKLTFLLLVAILLTACGPKPLDVVNAWVAALNKGDINATLSHLADDATVTIVPPAEGDGVYNGHAEIRGWYESLAATKGVTTLSDCQANGETVTCLDTYADEGLKAMGVDFIEGTWVAVIRDGKIQSYTFTITPESLAKFPPPPPSHQDVASAWQEALNKGDIDAALSYLADDATVAIIPPAEGDGIFNGHAEIRGWYESLVTARGITTLSDCQVNGETITCLDTYVDEGLKSLGVDFIEGEWAAVFRDGKIQSYAFTMTPESLAKFPPPPEPTPEPTQALVIVELPGVYRTSVGPNSYGIEAVRYLLELREDGRWFVRDLDKYIQVLGYYTYNADQIVVKTTGGPSAPSACVGIENTYEWSAEGDQLTFTAISVDANCEGEKFFFTQKPFTLQP